MKAEKEGYYDIIMENKLLKLDTFLKRMKKIGIEITLLGNIPWIYIDTINGKKVTEKYSANHGFTIGYYPVKIDDVFEFLDIKKVFELIRKYRHV